MVLFGGDGGAVHFIVDRRVNKGGVDPYLKRGRKRTFTIGLIDTQLRSGFRVWNKLNKRRRLVQNPVRDQWKPIFGAMYRRLAVADDWEKISDQKRAERLREAMAAEDKMYGRQTRFSEDFDFVGVVRYLAIP
jgi:hypothetical protein